MYLLPCSCGGGSSGDCNEGGSHRCGPPDTHRIHARNGRSTYMMDRVGLSKDGTMGSRKD